MMAAVLALSALSIQFAPAAEYSEKTQYLGVVNGQVVGNSVVKVAVHRQTRCCTGVVTRRLFPAV